MISDIANIVGMIFLFWFVGWVPMIIGSWLTVLVMMSLLGAATGKTLEQLLSMDQFNFVHWITIKPLWQPIWHFCYGIAFFTRAFLTNTM